MEAAEREYQVNEAQDETDEERAERRQERWNEENCNGALLSINWGWGNLVPDADEDW